MKYNDNGEYKDIYVKSLDTLPVGTEVDFDGNEVPSGWSETDKTYKSETYSLSGKTVTAGGSIELGNTPTISGKTFIGAFIKNGVSIAGLIGTIIDKNSSKIYLLCSNAQTFGSTSEVTITYMYADSKKIKKTSQYIEGGANLSNVYGTSQSNGYSQEYINNTLIGNVLYDNASGSNGNITLNDNVSNYEYIEVYFYNSSRGNSQKFLSSSSALSLTDMIFDSTYIACRIVTYNVANNTLSINSSRTGEMAIVTNGTFNVSSTNYFYITKVIGYKSTNTTTTQNTRSISNDEVVDDEDNR